LSVWHGTLRKKKASGGRKRAYRMKRKFESGSFPTETTKGTAKRRFARAHGGNVKARLLNVTQVNVSDPATGKTERSKITRVIENPANVDYDRRGVITKGTIIETPLGKARITSRPGQDGVANAILIPKKA
jgi:small subunit ribosomal protein S8e